MAKPAHDRIFHAWAIPVTMAILLALGLFSCGKEHGPASPFAGLTRIASSAVPGAAATLEIWHAGTLEDGYAPLVMTLRDSAHPDTYLTDAHIHLMPMMGMTGVALHGAPVENPGEMAVNDQFPGAIVFPMPGEWMLHVLVHNHLVDKEGEAMIPLTVQAAVPTEVQTVSTTDNRILVISRASRKVSPVKGMNDFELTLHHAVDLMTYEPDSSYTITITPEMPSMGHGSDGNVDPVHMGIGHYKGKVNFTMAGDWRMHVLLKKDGLDAALPFYFDARVN